VYHFSEILAILSEVLMVFLSVPWSWVRSTVQVLGSPGTQVQLLGGAVDRPGTHQDFCLMYTSKTTTSVV
jgi:hypothetical protein